VERHQHSSLYIPNFNPKYFESQMGDQAEADQLVMRDIEHLAQSQSAGE
jgi:hypothetical protein